MASFVDLPSTQVDAVDARRIAKGMNISEQNIFQFSGDSGKSMTLREIKASLHKRILEFQHLQDRGRHRIFLFVYVSGHGVSENG